MPTPVKPFEVLKAEKKSHRSKAELKQREQGEKELLSGVEFVERPEVAANEFAHKEFLRVSELMQTIGKNDALYEVIVNRYCILQAECSNLEERRDALFDVDFKASMDLDKLIQQKRKMLFDIERECCFTVASALRSIPKKVESKQNALKEALAK